MKSFWVHGCVALFLMGVFSPYVRGWQASLVVFIFSLTIFYLFFKIFILNSQRIYFIFIPFLFFLLGNFISSSEKMKNECVFGEIHRRSGSLKTLHAEVEKVSDSDRGKKVYLRAMTDKLFEGCERKRVGFLIDLSHDVKINVGDVVEAEGVIGSIPSFKTASGRWFDYENFLALDDYFFTLRKVDSSKMKINHSRKVLDGLWGMRGLLANQIDRIYEQPESALVAGILLGEKKALGKKLNEYFQRAGLTHIVVLSGFNVTIVLQSAFYLFSRMRISYRFVGAVVSIVAFVLLVGPGTTTVRAAIMSFIACSSKLFKRKYDVSSALCVSVLCMVMSNPSILIYSPGFHLSAISTFALIHFSPLVERLFTKILGRDEFGTVTGTIVSTLSTQIVALPYLTFFIGSVSLVGLLPNVIILPFIPFAMLVCFLAILVSFIGFSVSLPLIFVSSLIISGVLRVVQFFGGLSFAAITIPAHLSELVYMVPYGLFFAGFFYFRYRELASIKLVSITDQFRFAKKSST